jgi:predicted nucleotidyltransferase
LNCISNSVSETSTVKKIIDAIIAKNSFKLLNVFLFKPDVLIHQNEVIRMSGLSKNTVMKLLDLFTREGMLKVSRKGNLKLFLLVEGHPVVKQLKILINVSELNVILKRFTDKGFEAYLFGSAARGEDTENSDIDLLIIGKISNDDLADITAWITNAMNREVNPVIKTPYEYSTLYKTDKAFFENLERDRIRLT